jgi:quinolinate synthase
MSDEAIAEAIGARRKQLGDDLLILGHHYQQDDVIRHADLTGDSLKLSQMAAAESRKRGTKYIVFCGVHFMAETADILTDEGVRVILPDLSAGCSMADMADYDDAIEAWETIANVLGGPLAPASGEGSNLRNRPDRQNLPAEPGTNGIRPRLIPITYVNSSAAIKAFVGERGGACCTSSNARHVFEWALRGGDSPEASDDVRILFLPDQHLGRNTASSFGLRTEVDEGAGHGETQTRLWNPRKQSGGLSDDEIRRTKVFLWAGHCSVHKLFRPEHVDQVRCEYAEKGGIIVLVHPECCKEVVDKADLSGSTEYIIRQIELAPAGSNWAVGTEVHLVNRLSREAATRGVHVRILSDCQCLCTTMYRIDPQHLLWVLDNLAEGKVVNEIKVNTQARELAKLALHRMMANVSAQPAGMKLEPALVD